jgi:hypothetical protein
MLEERRRRKHDVGIPRGVGHHLVEHDREQVVAPETGQYGDLLGRRRDRIAVVHEERPHPR